MSALQYPVGRYAHEGPVSDEQLREWIGEIAVLPSRMRSAVQRLSDAQLDTAYRPGGWTLRQVVHHVPDSHLHALVRFKWALTESTPAIKAYDETAWAELGDVQATPVGVSLDLLEALHARWVALMGTMAPEDWDRSLVHPVGGPMVLRWMAGMYAWHGRHHLAHVTTTRERHGW